MIVLAVLQYDPRGELVGWTVGDLSAYIQVYHKWEIKKEGRFFKLVTNEESGAAQCACAIHLKNALLFVTTGAVSVGLNCTDKRDNEYFSKP